MGYAELIDMLKRLPPDQQAEVFDFAEFLATRSRAASEGTANGVKITRTLADLLAHPLKVKEGFKVMQRDERYDRAGLR